MRAVVILLLAPAIALSAPVPKETEKEKIDKLFGKIVDPKEDSKFALDGDKLVVTLPANETRGHDYEGNPDRGIKALTKTTTAPRLVREVDGDFTATVRVTITLDPKAKHIRDEYDWTFLAGGIDVSWSEREWYSLSACQQDEKGKVVKGYHEDTPNSFSKGGSAGLRLRIELPDVTWVQLKRTGKRIQYSISTDGKEFRSILSNSEDLPEGKLTLALSAHHSSDKAHTVTFDEFKVEPSKK
jgi:regulation of enolase protein 1 (concanavalin A-like superfamily)